LLRQRSSPYHLAGNRNASDLINAILNYAYAALESDIRIKGISEGYDPAIGTMREGTQSSLSGHSLQLRALCRKDWLFFRKEALVSLADGAASARDPTAPIGTGRSGARPGEGPGSPGPPG
jgi:CRISPR associated protein Cas1